MSVSDAAARMDRMYRTQRYIYDLTRKGYLLGRDHLIRTLDAAPGMNVLEIGCGTGRNLIKAAELYPDARFYGIDISQMMLDTAGTSIAKVGLSRMIQLAVADATAFDPKMLFGIESFDRIFISYTLSMIPVWQDVLAEAAKRLSPNGTLHVVDFGQQERLPGFFRNGLFAWLSWFDVTPRSELGAVMSGVADENGLHLSFQSLLRGYAAYGVMGAKP